MISISAYCLSIVTDKDAKFISHTRERYLDNGQDDFIYGDIVTLGGIRIGF